MLAHATPVDIFTYGGGEGLYKLFNAIAILTNEKSGFLVPFAFLCIVLGTFVVIIRAFFSQKIEAIFLHFAIPSCLLWVSLISVSTPVVIRDILAQTDHKVDHVPYLFALFCNMTSQLGNTITKGLESVLHEPNDAQYQKAGLIFGAQTVLDFNKYRLTNANLERNLNDFCKKCIFYDLSFGKYSIDDLKKNSNIWDFLKENTSKCRLVDYCSTQKEGNKSNETSKIKCELLSCKESITRMTEQFKTEKAYYNNIDFAKQLPLTFQALTKLKTANQDLVGQQLMMNVLTNNFPKCFALARSKGFLSETYLLMGSSFQTGIVAIRIVLEAILYLSIIIVIPLALLPGGLGTIKNWAFMYLWIQMWPPFFIIINYIFQIYAQADASQLLAGLSETQQGLSLYTSIGITELYHDVLAKCGFAYTLVPMISFAILKGGATSFVHLASSFVQSEQAAASSSASEMLSGNYSFGNVQYGQLQYENTNAFQNNTAPFISDGYLQVNNGELSQTFTPNRVVMRETLSDLSSNLYVESSIGSHLHHSKQMAENQAETCQQAYNESISESDRYLHDLTSHLANNESYSTNLSSREAQTAHEAACSIWNDAEQFSNQHNISSSDVLRAMLGAKLFGTGAETGTESGSSELSSKLQSYTSSTDFQERIEQIKDFCKTESYTDLSDEGKRISNSYVDSLEKVESYQDSLTNAYSRLNQISETADYFDQSSLSTRKQITQEFVDFTRQKCQEENYPWSSAEILTGKNDQLRDELLAEFSQGYVEKIEQKIPNGFQDPLSNYHRSSLANCNIEQKQKNFEEKYTIPTGKILKQKEHLLDERIGHQIDQDLSSRKFSMNGKSNQIIEQFEGDRSKYLAGRLYEHNVERISDSVKNGIDNFSPYAFPNLLPPHPLDPD
jgi:conjugal transfer mating pair stabilization protein TraG